MAQYPNSEGGIFLDSGDPQETRQALDVLGFLDGQTTNPSLVAHNPAIKKRIEEGKPFTKPEIYAAYKDIVQEISDLIPNGSVSVEVYADEEISLDAILKEAYEMNTWIPNAHIKIPIIPAGLEATHQLVMDGIRVNMTLCFSQHQGAAVHSATKGAEKGAVFISPFLGRLEDQGVNGLDLIKNILQMYKSAESTVVVLAASIRTVEQLRACLALGTDCVTAPLKVLKKFAEETKIDNDVFVYNTEHLSPLKYEEIDLTQPWKMYEINHTLTTAGLKRFSQDWNTLLLA